MTDGRLHLKLAEALARVMHEGQLRKGTGQPYVYHVERVARRVVGWKAKTVALMHDLVEDTEVTLDDLRRLRFPEDVVLAVDALSRRDGETYFEFIERGIATGSDEALLVKLADLRDNLHDDWTKGQPESLRARYIKADLMVRSELHRRGVPA